MAIHHEGTFRVGDRFVVLRAGKAATMRHFLVAGAEVEVQDIREDGLMVRGMGDCGYAINQIVHPDDLDSIG